jgi:hypothetical protein
MSRHSARFRRIAQASAGLLCAMALACSGGSDATAPDNRPPVDQTGNDQPGTPQPQPAPDISGAYGLALINQSQPGQLVTVANPDGKVVGLFRFNAASGLQLNPDHTWSLTLQYSDDKNDASLDDHGTYTQVDGSATDLLFQSNAYGDQFKGVAQDGKIAILYDFDGDGRPETIFGFVH